jgi:hypothetical protein
MGAAYTGPMPDHQAPAELVWTLHQPWRASLGECLDRWRALDGAMRQRSYLVVHGPSGARRTLAAAAIAVLAASGAYQELT